MKRVLILLAGVASVLTALTVMHTHRIQPRIGGQMYDSGQEAYLFITTTNNGWRARYLEVAWRWVVGLGLFVDDHRNVLTAVRITSTGVETATVDDFLDTLRVVNGKLFNGYQWKWSGIDYTPTTADEQREFVASRNRNPQSVHDRFGRTSDWVDLDDGWSYRCCLLPLPSGERRHELKFPDGRTVLVLTHDESSPTTRVALQRGSDSPIEVLELSERPRHVSRSEYEQLFSSPRPSTR